MIISLISWITVPRRFLGSVALFCLSMLAVGWFLQYAVGLTPCPLCIIQRVFFGGVGVVAFVGWMHGRVERVYLSVMLTLALLGGTVAARNVYIERVPQGLDAQCLPWLESLTDWIAVLFQATGDCAVRDWTLLGLSIPEWSLIAFAALVFAISWMLVRETTSSSSTAADQA